MNYKTVAYAEARERLDRQDFRSMRSFINSSAHVDDSKNKMLAFLYALPTK